jgi:hypothetical protein
VGTRIARFAAAAAVVLGAAAVAAPVGGSHTAALPHVTIFGDSVSESLINYVPARRKFADGLDVDWEIEPCRRLAQESCPFNGVRPPTVLDVVQDKGSRLGSTVIVAVGYNDFEDTYAANIADVIAALRKAGVDRVLWLTLHAARHSYLNMNDDIALAAAKYPQMRVIDWNGYSRTHDDWFQDDGIHLQADGANAMATLIHTTLVQLGVIVPETTTDPGKPPNPRGEAGPPLRVKTLRLPVAHKGHHYAVKLSASGGKAPYFWSLPARLPRGLTLRPTGWITGTPRGRLGIFALAIRVRDAGTKTATTKLGLRIRR